MTTPKLDMEQAKRICEAATEGPWRVYRCGDSDDVEACGIKQEPFVSDREDAYQRGVVHDTNRDECHHMMVRSNAEFIAFARTALPAALEEIERLRGLVEEACDLARQFDVNGAQPGERARLTEIARAAKGTP